jgi:CRP-like cAMP-binding protein
MYQQVTAYIRQRVAVPDEALNEAFGYSKAVCFRKGDIIVRAGEYCRFIGWLNAGLIMVTLTDDTGKEDVVCNFFIEDDFFTHIESINANIPSNKNLIALEDCEVLMLNKSDLPLIFSIHPAFEALFNKIIMQGLHKVILLAQERQIQTVEERYLSMMVMHPSIMNRVPLKFIASYLGVAPPSLSRMRRRLQKKSEINLG